MRELTVEEREALHAHAQWLEDSTTGHRANLQDANLQGANLDFSCWPLWCGSRNVRVDMLVVYQLLAHVATLKCDDEEFNTIRDVILPHAQRSHHAGDLGLKRAD